MAITLLISSFIATAQNVGIGTTEPTNKLQVAGNILVSQPSVNTVTAPVPGQTKTMINGSTVSFVAGDSTGRLYDPGGPAGNYIDNLNATCFISGATQLGVLLTIESINLETGDSLLIKITSTTAPSVLAFGKGNQATGNFTINSQGLPIAIVFKSNGDGINAQGFSLLFKRLYTGSNSGVSNFAGNGFYFNTATAATRGGLLDPDDVPGNGSTAFGTSSSANGFSATALGYNSTASGPYAIAMGNVAAASGFHAVAIGSVAAASGNSSVAIGESVTASGDNSVALGSKVNTNNFDGAFFFGDSDPHLKGIRTSGAANQFVGRFNGGYYFISSNAGASDIGVQVLPGGNSWSAVSDVNRKENFAPVDGENFLQKIRSLNLSSWNYKGQNAKAFRHYGPMAQEFYAAFGKDDYGTIGCDTLINQQDFLGVNLIAVQALEKRTADLKNENDELKKKNSSLEARLEKLEKFMAHRLD